MQKFEIVDALNKVRSLIEAGWVQGRFAGIRHNNGYVEQCFTDNPNANCFCLIGAIKKVSEQDNPNVSASRLVSLIQDILRPDRGVSEFNDHPNTRKEDVLMVLDQAIEKVSQ